MQRACAKISLGLAVDWLPAGKAFLMRNSAQELSIYLGLPEAELAECWRTLNIL